MNFVYFNYVQQKEKAGSQVTLLDRTRFLVFN
jgi:hypothetical protein